MTKIRILKTERDHRVAVEKMSELMDADIKPNTSAEVEFELLQLVISSYESKVAPRPKVTPVEAIKFRMEQQGLARKDLVPFIGSLPKVSEVLSGERPLSLAMIKRLNKGLGIAAAALIAEDDVNDKSLEIDPSYQFDKFPLQEMYDRGLFPNFQAGVSRLKQHAEDLVKGFLRNSYSTKAMPALLRAPLHQSGARTMDDYALLVWRACVIKKAYKFPPRARYKPDVVTTGWLRDLAKLSSFDGGPRLAHEYLSKHGICLVVEHRFNKTYLDGAAMLDGAMPIVALTLRHDRLDNFWFTLLHEVVHVQKHLDTSRLFIADNLEDKTRSSHKEEQEADEGAQEALIPARMWKTSKVQETSSAEDALELAQQAGVHPCIVAGRVRHHTGNWRLLSNVISEAGSVKPYFMDQLESA